jgi:TonB-dependent starch-binding outer membrane protein SusC
LITTKKGKAGAMKFDLNLQAGIGRVACRLDMMNTRQYLDMRYEAFRNDNIDWTKPSVSANDLKVWDTTHYTDWQQELIGGNARYTNLNASVSGGTNTIRYLVSGTYNKQTTVFPFPDFADQKGSVHFNLNANNNTQKFRMQFSGNFMVDDNRLPQNDLTQVALLMAPDAPPLLNADGSINWAPDASGNTTLGGIGSNVMIQKLQQYQNKTYNLISSLKVEYTILPGLNIGTSAGFNYMQTNDYSPSPLIAVAPELRSSAQRSAAFGDRNIQSWIMEPQANYRTTLSNGTLDVIVGSTFQENTATSNLIIGKGQLSDDLLDNVNAAATISKLGGSFTNYKYTALFARANFNWSDKYIVNLNGRRDGSSRFGADNLFHNFGSLGAAWIFSSEPFFKRFASHISFGKLRGSYGTTGSDQINDYQFMSLYNLTTNYSLPYQGILGLAPAGLPNPALQWEETRKLQVGIDVGLFQDKLMINATFVRNRSSNQLLSYRLPTQTGFPNYLVNFPATIQNKNWELLVTGKLIQQKDFAWTSSINVTLPKNKLIEFPNLDQSTYAGQLKVGEPLDVTTVYHWLGVAPGTGDYLYADKKGNPTLAPNPNEDGTILVSKFPKFYGGLDNTFTYKNFQVNFIVQFVQQTMYNDVAFSNGFYRFPGMFQPGTSNQPVTLFDRWQRPGDANPVARYSTTDRYSNYILASDRRLLDGWYIRLKNISVSWDLPQKWLDKARVRSFRLYVHGQNLLTVTNYKGLDPETQSSIALPPLQVWTGGIQLGL